MNMKISRREVLQFVGGSALGVLLSPIPWKVLDDTAIWTQNWPWMPKPMRGDITSTLTSCTLCPAACGMRSRTVGVQPVSLTGIRQHPFNHGALCTTGILAHHLRYHPARLKKAVKLEAGAQAPVEMTAEEAMREASSMLKRAQSVLIADHRPGRAVSALYRELASSAPGFRYAPVAPPEISALSVLSGNAALEAGYDLGRARFILSFGAPLFDGWGSPSRTSDYVAARGSQTLVQIEPVRSRTAQLAGRWIPSRPGTDGAIALSMAFVLTDENLLPASSRAAITDIEELTAFLRAYAPERIAASIGIDAGTVRETARRFAHEGPALALVSRDAGVETRSAVMLLNILAGSVGAEGGIALRMPPPASASQSAGAAALLEEIPDHSLDAVILDESLSGSSVPDALLRAKLKEGRGVILSLSPFVTPRPYALQYVIPSTVIFETLTDVPGPFDAPASSLALSRALLPAPEGTTDAIGFARAAAASLGVTLSQSGSSEEILKARIAALHAAGRGTVFSASSAETKEMKQLASSDDLWTALSEGGCWIDASSQSRPARMTFRVMPAVKAVPPAPEAPALIVYPLASAAAYSQTAVSPLMSKLTQESGLRLSQAQASVNPATASSNGIVHGETISIRTKNGSVTVQARLDASVMPGVLFVSCQGGSCSQKASSVLRHEADVRTICEVSSSGSYSPTPVTIQKVYL